MSIRSLIGGLILTLFIYGVVFLEHNPEYKLAFEMHRDKISRAIGLME